MKRAHCIGVRICGRAATTVQARDQRQNLFFADLDAPGSACPQHHAGR
jgi:hypothetical protein